MPRAKKEESISVGHTDLANALVQAIEAAKPPAKKTAFNRKKNTPWTPKNGEPRLKLKRKAYQHSIPMSERITNEDIALLNKIRPGVYCDGFVRVVRRKDKGIDIDYPIRTRSQQLTLMNKFGIRNFTELLQRIHEEAESPKKLEIEDLD